MQRMSCVRIDFRTSSYEHLKEFILELGEGFCFEARQKRIVIDDKYYFIDLVFIIDFHTVMLLLNFKK